MEYPECFHECWRTARKEHKCCECLEVIPKRTRYQYCSGIWAGEPADYKTCWLCALLRRDITAADKSYEGLALGELGYYCEESGDTSWLKRWYAEHPTRQVAALAD